MLKSAPRVADSLPNFFNEQMFTTILRINDNVW
jgi:hypothetical protein